MKTIKNLLNLKEHRVLITGAGGGIGRVMADSLAELGASLILVDRPGVEIACVATDIRDRWSVDTISLECDLESTSSRLELVDIVISQNKLNCLINNAAFAGETNLPGWVTNFEGQSLDTWRRAIEVNLTAAFHLSQAFTPLLKKSAGANIINIASIYGEYGPDWRLYEGTQMGNPAAYAASKGGLIQLTRWLATTLAPEIRVNAISPGGVLRNQPSSFVRRYIDRTPMRRMATEDDFRGTVAFLASNLSQYITGQIIRVDGGWGNW